MSDLFADLRRDVRYATRTLRRTPALTAAIVLSLALGIGANTAIVSVIDVLILRALPVRSPEQLVLLSMTRLYFPTDHTLFEKFRDGAENIADLSAIIHTDRYNVPISDPPSLADSRRASVDRPDGAAAIDSGPVRLALVSGNYFSYRDKEAARRLRSMMIAVRTAGDPLAMAARIRQELRDIELQLPVLRIDTVEQQLNDVLVQERLMALVSSFFGSLALLLASVGLYGVISYAVARRTAEIGVRLALGATRGRLLRTILGESLTLVAAGLAIGVPIALALTRLTGARLFGVSPVDPLTIAAASMLMTLVAAAASFFPARRAARVDPMVALRCD